MPRAAPRAAWVLGLWLLALALAAGVVSRTTFTADMSAFLPASPDAHQRVLIDQLQDGVASRTLLVGIEDGAGAVQRAQVSRAVAATLRASSLFDQVQNGDGADFAASGQWLLAHRYLLSPAVTPRHFTVEGLRDAIDDSLSLLGTPAGNAIKPLLDRDPTGEVQRIAEGLIPASAPRSEDGVWVSRNAPRAVLLLTTRAAGGDLDAQARAVAAVRVAFAQATHGLAAAPRLLVSGAPLFSIESRDTIKSEAKRLAILGALVMSALLLAAFASPRALALALLPVASGVLAGTAAVALAFGAVHGMTLGFGSTLIGESVDYAIYYLIQARSAPGAAAAGTGWQRWRVHQWPTVRLGLLTSVCGFGALVFSGFPGLAQLGVFSLAGLLGAAATTRFVLPVLAPDGATGHGLRRHLAQLAGALVQSLPRLRHGLLALGLASLALVLWQGAHLWRADLSDMSPVPPAALALDAQLRADIGASEGGTLVMVQGASLQDVLRATEAASARLEPLVGQGVLAGYDAVTRLLPSERTQVARRASLPPPDELRQRLAAATAGGPLPASRLEPFVEQVAAARTQPLIDVAALRASPLGGVVNAMLFQPAGGGWTSVLALHAGPRFDAARLRQALTPVAAAQVVGVKAQLDGLYRHYLHEALLQVSLGALAVLLLLGFWMRSGRRLLAVALPLAFAVLLTLGALALAGVALGILHLVGLLLVVAVGSNYALFFDQLRQAGQPDEDTLASLLLANLTTVASFGLIAFSDIAVLSAIGRVVAPGALLALLLAAAFARHPDAGSA